MSLIKDALNHKKAEARRFEQLELLDKLICERAEKADSLSGELEELEERLAHIRAFYPGLDEEQATLKYFESLKNESARLSDEITKKEAELNQISERLGIMQELDNIAKARAKLEEEKRSFQEFKNSNIRVRDVIICLYDVGIRELIVDAFIYFANGTYVANNGDEQECRLYQDMSGNRIVGFSKDMKESLAPTIDFSINTFAEAWFQFIDVYTMVELYPAGTFVKPEFISSVVKSIINDFTFAENKLQRKKRS